MNPELLKKLLAKHGYINLVSINVTSGSTFQVHKLDGSNARYKIGFDFVNEVIIMSQNRDTSDTRFTVDYVEISQVEAVVFNATPVVVTPENSPEFGITPAGFAL